MVTKRTLLYVNPGVSNPKNVLAGLDQTEDALILATNGTPIVKQLKLTIELNELPSEWADLFKSVGMFELAVNNAFNNEMNDQLSLFSDWKESIPMGQCLKVAPQTATTLAQYKNMSASFKGTIFDWLEWPNDDEMTFNHEWWQWCHLEREIKSIDKIAQWFKLSRDELECTQNWDAFRLILDKNILNLYIYWDINNKEQIILPKSASGVSEFAMLFEMADLSNFERHELSLDRAVEGVRGDLLIGEESKFIPSLLLPLPQHSRMLDWSIIDGFEEPTGLHPTYVVNITKTDENPIDLFEPYHHSIRQCTLQWSMNLPKEIIVDKYQLGGSIGRSHCIDSIEVSNDGMDLELPSYEIKEFGSVINLQLNEKCVESNMGFKIPFHLRYASPSPHEHQLVQIPHGDLYWSCDVDNELWQGISKSFNYISGQLDITKLKDFGDNGGRYYHFSNSNPQYMLNLTLPVADYTQLPMIQNTTLVLVISSFLILLWKCVW